MSSRNKIKQGTLDFLTAVYNSNKLWLLIVFPVAEEGACNGNNETSIF